jgi:hypothetical protein
MNLKSILIISLFFATLVGFLSSCSDDPTSIGYQIDTLLLNAISSEQEPIILGSRSEEFALDGNFATPFLVIGKANDITAYSIMRFGTTKVDTFEYVNESDIISAKFVLNQNRYAFGDSLSSNNLSFSIRELTNTIFINTTTDSIVSKGGITSYYGSEELGSFNGKFELKDTMASSTFSLPPKIIKKWLGASKDTSSEYAKYKNGLVFVPNASSKVVNRFLTQIGNSNATTEIIVEFNNSRKSKLDTIKIPLSLASNFIFNDYKVSDRSLHIQGGKANRGYIDFDLSKLPQFASIIATELTLHLDPQRSINSNFVRDSIIFATDTSRTTKKNPTILFEGYKLPNKYEYVFPSITSSSERWVRTENKKGTVMFVYSNRRETAIEEFYNLDRLVFWGVDAPDPTKKPKLKIIYSRRPKN